MSDILPVGVQNVLYGWEPSLRAVEEIKADKRIFDLMYSFRKIPRPNLRGISLCFGRTQWSIDSKTTAITSF